MEREDVEGFEDIDSHWTDNFFGLVTNPGTYARLSGYDTTNEYNIGTDSLREDGIPGPHKKAWVNSSPYIACNNSNRLCSFC